MSSISTGFYDEFSGEPSVPPRTPNASGFRPFADGVAWDTLDPVDFWYPIAQRAQEYFGLKNKEEFMRWVRSRYQGDQNHMAASCCWDIIRLEEV